MTAFAVNCALGAWAATAAGADLRFQRVPNALLVVLWLPALAVLLWSGRGPLDATPIQSLLGLLAAGVPLLPGYALGQLGAGDVKFSASLGFLLGAAPALEMLLVGAVLLGLVSALVLVLRRLRWQVPDRIPATPAFAAAFALQLVFSPVLF